MGEALARYLHIPFSSMGIITGCMGIPPYTIPVFVGSALSRFVLGRFIKDWESRKAVIAAGLVTGQGIILSIGVALMLLSKATWVKPW